MFKCQQELQQLSHVSNPVTFSTICCALPLHICIAFCGSTPLSAHSLFSHPKELHADSLRNPLWVVKMSLCRSEKFPSRNENIFRRMTLRSNIAFQNSFSSIFQQRYKTPRKNFELVSGHHLLTDRITALRHSEDGGLG